MEKCNCCGNKINSQVCNYCGFVDRAFSDIETSESGKLDKLIGDYKKSKEYRNSLLSHVSSIGVSALCMKYNKDDGLMEQSGTTLLFDDLESTAYNHEPVFSDRWIAHFDSEVDITIHYQFDGTEKSVVATIVPEEQEGIWYLGLYIADDLSLEILLRVVSVDNESDMKDYLLTKVDLDLIS